MTGKPRHDRNIPFLSENVVHGKMRRGRRFAPGEPQTVVISSRSSGRRNAGSDGSRPGCRPTRTGRASARAPSHFTDPPWPDSSWPVAGHPGPATRGAAAVCRPGCSFRGRLAPPRERLVRGRGRPARGLAGRVQDAGEEAPDDHEQDEAEAQGRRRPEEADRDMSLAQRLAPRSLGRADAPGSGSSYDPGSTAASVARRGILFAGRGVARRPEAHHLAAAPRPPVPGERRHLVEGARQPPAARGAPQHVRRPGGVRRGLLRAGVCGHRAVSRTGPAG
jgi:hypothetical protein